MIQAITQEAKEATKVAVQAMSEVAGPTERNNSAAATQNMNVISNRTFLKQKALNLKVKYNYNES